MRFFYVIAILVMVGFLVISISNALSFESQIAYFPPPRQQIESGIHPQQVTCTEGLELIFKLTDSSPLCVKPKTAEKLIEREFGTRTILVFDQTSKLEFNEQKFPEEKCNIEEFPVDWSGCDLYGKVLTNVDLRFANLSHANLYGATLADKDLTGADLSYASLKKANLDGANLTQANLSYANLIDTEIRNADLSYSIMKNAKLWRTDFTSSNLTNANLQDSTLSYAILSFTDLNGANLDGAGTWQTNLNHCHNHPICKDY